ncbi:MAG TPA: hypothetical protein VFH63_10215 [candidate division Zixibacteria bacterium]|nr:hypothetical protein [candidate division Zixibacteria bacterium]
MSDSPRRPDAYADLWSTDRDRQNAAYGQVLAAAEGEAPWAYEVWDDVVQHLAAADNHDRSIAAQLLARLASSDPERRILRDLPALVAVTRDQRFVTARHALQSLWRVGLAGDAQRAALLDALAARFGEAADEKNGTLVRYDIAVGLRQLHDATGDPAVRDRALALIDTEADAKYRRKYLTAWRGAR